MSKIFILKLFLFICLLSSCNNQHKSDYSKALKNFVGENINYTIYKTEFGTNVSKSGEELDTSKGYFLKILLGVENKSNQKMKFDTSFFKLQNSSNTFFEFSKGKNEFFSYFDTSLFNSEIESQKIKSGFIVFDIPKIDNYSLVLYNNSTKKESFSFFINPL
jgi:hypothetical protein